MQYLETLGIFHHFLDVVQARIAKFNHLVAIHTNQVIVVAAGIGFFKLADVLPKLVFGNQKTIDQQIQRIVNRSPADPIVLLFHRDKEAFYIEVPGPGINFFQNGESLWRFPKLFLLQIRSENLGNFLVNSWV